jgi:hypothetical protein
MPEVIFLKLVSGEEIICGFEADDGVSLTVTDPLCMESGIDDDDPSRRYVFMSRYSPYGQDPHIVIKHAAVVFHVPVSGMVARYYDASLKYCKLFTDPKFVDGIMTTTEQIEGSLKDENPQPNDDNRASEMLARALALTSNTTCH